MKLWRTLFEKAHGRHATAAEVDYRMGRLSALLSSCHWSEDVSQAMHDTACIMLDDVINDVAQVRETLTDILNIEAEELHIAADTADAELDAVIDAFLPRPRSTE
jgi:hypothetical protein